MARSRTAVRMTVTLILVLLLAPASLVENRASVSAADLAFGFDFPVNEDGGPPPSWASFNVFNEGLRNEPAPCYGKTMADVRHAGEDWFRDPGTEVRAVANGRVIFSRDVGYEGAVVIIRHNLGNGWMNPWGVGTIHSMYGHLDPARGQGLIANNVDVVKGQVIGRVVSQPGNNHLHFEIRRFGDMTNRLVCPATGRTTPYGPGYTDTNVHPNRFGYLHPSDWIRRHRGDKVAPSVSWQGPVEIEEVYYTYWESILLQVGARDNVGVIRVDFWRWDHPRQVWVFLGRDPLAPYQRSIHSSSLNPEWNQVNACGGDQNGNWSCPHIWIFRLSNAAAARAAPAEPPRPVSADSIPHSLAKQGRR